MSSQDLACLNASWHPPPLLSELDSRICNHPQLQKIVRPTLKAWIHQTCHGHRWLPNRLKCYSRWKVFNPDRCSLDCHPLSLVSKFGLLLSWIQTDHNMHCILIICMSYFVCNMIFFEFMYHISLEYTCSFLIILPLDWLYYPSIVVYLLWLDWW
jgi:hypothetical protein